MLLDFEYEGRRSLAVDHAVAGGVEGAASAGRIVAAARQLEQAAAKEHRGMDSANRRRRRSWHRPRRAR